MDFNPKQFVPMIARMVLGSISQNFRYVLDGAVAAMAVMLFFHGEGKFFHRLWSLQFALSVAFIVSYAVQRGISTIVSHVEGTPAAGTKPAQDEKVELAPESTKPAAPRKTNSIAATASAGDGLQ